MCRSCRSVDGLGCPVCGGWREVIQLSDGRIVAGTGGPRCRPCPRCGPQAGQEADGSGSGAAPTAAPEAA